MKLIRQIILLAISLFLCSSAFAGLHKTKVDTDLNNYDWSNVVDEINDLMLDWGTGANQVSAADMPDEDIGDITISSGVYTVDSGAIHDLTIDAKEKNTSAIVKGQAVYVSGSAGAGQTLIGLINNTDSTKIRALGLAASAFTQNGTGTVRFRGELSGIDTLGTNAVNPNGETWAAGDILYCTNGGSGGGLTNVKPTSGRIIRAGYSLIGSHNNDTILVQPHENPICLATASGEDICVRMGDNDGTNKVCFKDYANNDVACVDSNGVYECTGLTIGAAVILEAELEILDDATLSTTQINYLASATGTTGTTSTNLVFSTSPTLVTPVLGTPASGVMTNVTGTASGLTAGNVTTNANLTGEVTSVGNAATLDPTCISDKADTTITDADYVLFLDATDSLLKKVDAAELTAGGGATAYDDIGNPDASGSIAMGAFTGTYTSATDGWGGLIISNTDADNTSDTTLLTLAFTDDGDTNSHYMVFKDAGGTQQFEIIQSGANIRFGGNGNELDINMPQNFLNNVNCADLVQLEFGASGTDDAMFRWNTSGTNVDHLQLSLDEGEISSTGYLCIVKAGNRNNSNHFPTGFVSNPTIRLWSGDGTDANDWFDWFHNQTDGVFQTGAGDINLIPAGGDINVTGDVNPEADGTRDLGTQTTAQWANLWADLVNGADIALNNGWRILESEKYKGYEKGFAIGNTGFKNGIVTPTMSDNCKPIFVITENFIEFHGIRFNKKELLILKELINE